MSEKQSTARKIHVAKFNRDDKEYYYNCPGHGTYKHSDVTNECWTLDCDAQVTTESDMLMLDDIKSPATNAQILARRAVESAVELWTRYPGEGRDLAELEHCVVTMSELLAEWGTKLRQEFFDNSEGVQRYQAKAGRIDHG